MKNIARVIVFGSVAAVAVAHAQAPQGNAPAPAGRGGQGQAQTAQPPARGFGGGGGTAGPGDKPIVDAAAAERGKTVWLAECVTCHGPLARGTDTGPNLLRSLVFLRDRYGSELGPYVKKGHPLQSGRPSSSLTDAQITDISHFLRKQLNDTLRGSPAFTVQKFKSGDPKAGEEFFNGAGKCSGCHSPDKDLAGIAARYETVDLQQRMLFPGGGRGRRGGGPPPSAVRVTVTPPGGAPVSGVVVDMDDFVVSLRDASGTYRSFRRTPALKIDKTDPLEAHRALLDTITDKQIHDVVAYLETLR
jgi:cytochrome c oxidase cbb3-type subunit 3